jgi:hypothetical protein
MPKPKFCPKCTDMLLRNVNLNVDIESSRPTWVFLLRSKLAKPFFAIGSWILGANLRMKTWSAYDNEVNHGKKT